MTLRPGDTVTWRLGHSSNGETLGSALASDLGIGLIISVEGKSFGTRCGVSVLWSGPMKMQHMRERISDEYSWNLELLNRSDDTR